MAAYGAGFAALSVLRQRAFATGRFDLGNMVQAVWWTAHGHPLRMTNLHGDQISRLAAHVDPMLAVCGPVWWIWPSPDLLLVVQALAIAAGAFPVYWLARKHLRSARAGLGFALAYLLYPATGWLALNEFHPVALAAPLLLFAFWFLDEGRLLPFALFAVAASLCKEEIPFVVAGFGIWYAVSHRRPAAGVAIVLAGLIAPLVIAAVFGARRLSPRRFAVAASLVLVTLAANYRLGPIPVWQHVPGGQRFQATAGDVTAHDRIAERAIDVIPRAAVVSATNSLGAHLSARRRVLSFPFVQDATWIAADETQPGYADRFAPLATAVQLAWLRRNPEWTLLFEQDGVLVFRRVAP